MFNTPRRLERAPGFRAPLPVDPVSRVSDPSNAAHTIGSTPPEQPGRRSFDVGTGAGDGVSESERDRRAFDTGMGFAGSLVWVVLSGLLFPPSLIVWAVVYAVIASGPVVERGAFRRGYDDELARLVREYGHPDNVPPGERARLLGEVGLADSPAGAREHEAAHARRTEGPVLPVPEPDVWRPSSRF